MNKKYILSSLFALGLGTAFAGPMGPVKVAQTFTPFIDGEALYAWPQIGGFSAQVLDVATVNSNMTNKGWGGRGAFGFMAKYTPLVSFSAEAGWGYYGHVNLNPTVTADPTVVQPFTKNSNDVFRVNMDSYAFDILGGVYYTEEKYDLFFKAGAFFENIRTSASLNPGILQAENRGLITRSLNGAEIDITRNLAQVLPVIKLGGDYMVYNNLYLTASWLHAFGGDMSINSSRLNIAAGHFNFGNLSLNVNNPTLNAVLFGMEYRFNA